MMMYLGTQPGLRAPCQTVEESGALAHLPQMEHWKRAERIQYQIKGAIQITLRKITRHIIYSLVDREIVHSSKQRFGYACEFQEIFLSLDSWPRVHHFQ